MNRFYRIIIILITLLSASFHEAVAAPASNYASSSRLASGRWMKVKVERSGMQFVSNSVLSSMGFKDPSKVNAYGFGGGLISENLSDYHPDDLPLLPTLHVAGGILFFGVDNTVWRANSMQSDMVYQHSSNPYSDDSFYFLSDITVDEYELRPATIGQAPSGTVTSFTERMLYEKDMAAPSNTGRVLLGEDFRSPASRTFTFQMDDKVSNEVRFKVNFATRTTGGSSSLMFNANGVSVPATNADIIPAVSSTDQFMRVTNTVKQINLDGNNLQLQINYRGSGTILLARLDYIELEYIRRLALKDNQLYFHKTDDKSIRMQLSGCDDTTVVWDVTNPSVPAAVTLEGSGATRYFNSPEGERHYIAFNPAKAGYVLAAGEPVQNQDVHALPIPDMLIITPMDFMTAAEKIADHHRDYDGMTVHVLTPEVLYNEFSSGTTDVSAFRKALKMWYDRGKEADGDVPRYCLIMSRPTFDHKTPATKPGHPIVPIWLSPDGLSGTTSYSTDDFIGMLQETSGRFSLATAKIDVAVGRFPVTDAADAMTMVDKLINYVENPDLGSWRKKVLIIADDQDSGVHLSQAENVYSRMISPTNGYGNKLQYERLYLDAYPIVPSATGFTYPAAKERLLKLWNEGLLYIDYIGHASPKEWGHEDLLNWNDLNSFSNTKLPFLYAATCEFARWDAEDECGAEVLWRYPSSGIIATICPNRTVYISQNGILNNSTHQNVFMTDEDGKGKRIGDIMIEGKNSYGSSDDNKLRYVLMGDPAMRLPTPSRSVDVESISGIDLSDDEAEAPVLQARGRAEFSGVIRMPDGSVDTDFNGIVEIELHDAEIPVETNGNGENGRVMMYNDRKTRLYVGSARVNDGRWTATILMPSEIENNFSPARISLYAYSSESGNEANGACDSFYVYGFDTTATEDVTGPEINFLGLNREDFMDGDLVHSSPVVLASFSDESGINLSDAGIGHKITLKLDDKKYFEDVNSYYISDPDDNTAGSVAYPLSDLLPGEHTLQLTVWDNANNSSSKSISFTVGVAKQPVIYTLDTDVNPARESVKFMVSTDRPMAKVECIVEVFDLNGRTVWSSNGNLTTDITAGLSIPWNLCDRGGQRVPRGIYLYRATIISPEGRTVTASRRLAVTAQ